MNTAAEGIDQPATDVNWIAEWMYHWPVEISAAWWRLMWHDAERRAQCPHRRGADLVVPALIQEDGEHALFA